MTLRPSLIVLLFALTAHSAFAQDAGAEAASSNKIPSPEEMLAEIDRRAGNASGYDALLEDPDPRRSAVAVALMMETGNEELMRKAISFGLASPEPSIRSTTLTYYLRTQPTFALDLDAAGVADDELSELDDAIRSAGGSLGPDKKGSFSVALGPWDEDKQCFSRVSANGCSARINAQSISVFVNDQWINLNPNLEGDLEGGMSVQKYGKAKGSVKVMVRLVE